MGGATKQKQQEKENNQARWDYSFARHNEERKTKNLQAEPPIANDLMPYKKFAIRPFENFEVRTKSKNKDKQRIEMVRFAFGKYRVSKALSNVWNTTKENTILPIFNISDAEKEMADMKKWYVCVATGGSLYKEYAKPFLSKKEVHCLITCNHEFSPNQLLCYAAAKAVADKNDSICLKISHSKLREKTFNPFWKSVIAFFAKNPEVTKNQINDLTDYFTSRYNENNNYSLAGNTLAALLKRMEDWHRDLQRAKNIGDHKWIGFDIQNNTFEKKGDNGEETTWVFKQILNSKALAAEGNAMRHCVYSYRNGCSNGELSVWSLVKINDMGESRKLTIELRKNKTIVQARGLANRSPRSEEKQILNAWCNQNGLHISPYIY